MRVVLLGKGGSGKSSLAGLLCAALSEQGEQVVAIDADTVPGLAQVLGMPASDEWFLAGMAARKNGGWQLEASTAEVVQRCTRAGPNGIRFLQLGKATADFQEFEQQRQGFPERWSAMVAFNTVVRSFDEQDGWVVIDLQGGTLQVAAGMAGREGMALALVEPFAKSVLTLRRFVEMGEWPAGMRLVAVANKVTGAADQEYLESELDRLGVPLWASIPEDPAITRAEREGEPLVSVQEGTPAQQAVRALADRLRDVARTPQATPTG